MSDPAPIRRERLGEIAFQFVFLVRAEDARRNESAAQEDGERGDEERGRRQLDSTCRK
ncbi:MAG: hypothetical protein OEY37_13220 [Gammaproteobacteria bacterium]|nr:hypothetical protein [Gammaproteobacteria bacterium]MDH5617603.1 hypothetical protein [Gammaproteobacteria bacterium]